MFTQLFFKCLESKPEDGIFYEHSEFFSKLKQKAITNKEFQNSKFLFLTLKMKKFWDMKDLCNFQNVCLLFKTVLKKYVQCTASTQGDPTQPVT